MGRSMTTNGLCYLNPTRTRGKQPPKHHSSWLPGARHLHSGVQKECSMKKAIVTPAIFALIVLLAGVFFLHDEFELLQNSTVETATVSSCDSKRFRRSGCYSRRATGWTTRARPRPSCQARVGQHPTRHPAQHQTQCSGMPSYPLLHWIGAFAKRSTKVAINTSGIFRSSSVRR